MSAPGHEPRTGYAFGLAATAVSAVVAGLAYGAHALWLTVAMLGPVGLLTVGAVHLLLRRRAWLGGMRRQLSVAAALVVGQLLVALGLFVALMFVSGHDAFFTVLVALYAGAMGLLCARLMATAMVRDVDRVRDAVTRIGGGERDVRVAIEGRDELALIARDVELMQNRLASEERARTTAEAAHRDLLGAVSHDLRTPITALRLLTDALDDDLVEDAARRDYVRRIGTHVRALSALIDDLFELSRLQAGDIRWTMERIAVADLVAETVDAMRPQAAERCVLVRSDVCDQPPPATGNPEQIQRVLFNLIQNAIRHTPADGSITVRAESAPGAVEVEVADTGQGIVPQDRRHVFEPFFQGGAHPARSNGAAGLGLAISRAIVEAHGGRIWLIDSPSGTRVRFSLPVAV